MGLLWSEQVKADLENIAPAVRAQIRRNAEVALPDIQPCTGRTPEGILWHRGITHELEREVDGDEEEDAEGLQAWDYYLFYQQLSPGVFEVFAVLSTHQIASMGGHMILEPLPDVEDDQ